ncbi:hypothetical protein GOFOIKOB_5639 [Methylobacterium tardum]|uniref:Uncharacterized protein n=1 Tax=Methylobacterium tardum TaxID=374432 RepID=A0AA37TMR4_9HYPH|nr:DNA-binding protein [Methylobacterium tardum]URD35239.1 DNA-binding protein [Methylobacterium tardum]GJE52566.1 hypothetical protein GOFOIKOB_5639 [Methylobacterium tardum]GLS73759.1 hypothetical protein GCM10007890_57740 [Methylobacterium tardum]
MTSENSDLYGVTIEMETARRALRMGRDSFAAAVKAGEIPSVKVGKRHKILGVPFRRMVGLPERAPVAEAVAA